MPEPISTSPENPTQIGGPGPERAGGSWSWHRFWRNAVIIAVLGSTLGWFAAVGVWPNVSPKRFGVVVEGSLYRSGELTAASTRRVVERHGIRTIVDLGAHEPGSIEEQRAQRVAEALGVERVRLNLSGDARGDPNDYVAALRIATDPDRGPVLVHCAAGAQRTSCAIALFRMIEHGWTLERAIEEARQYDHDPADNPHVVAMIERWGEAVAAALAGGGGIAFDAAGGG